MNSLREENTTLLYALAYNADFFMRFVDFFTKGMKWIDQIEKLKKMNVQLSKREESNIKLCL